MREILSLGLLALACGTAMREPLGCAQRIRPKQAAMTETRAPVAQSAEPFAALVARGRAIAPGMREVTRAESSGDRVEIARAEGRDACVRVAFAASSPVVAKLMDGEGNLLASSDAPTTDGVLGERGPVCVRRGETVSAVAEGAGASVRWVGWESP